jgi:oligopeptidase B
MNRLALLVFGSVSLIGALAQMQETLKPPVAARVEHREVRHGTTVVDDYYWLREKSNPQVTRYLEAENAYTEAMTKALKPFEDALYKEMLGRIKQTDLSVPVRDRGYFYYNRTEEGKQYPIFCRRKGNMDAPQEVLVDLNELAKGHGFVGLGSAEISDDQNVGAYTTDYTGYRQYSLYLKDFRTGLELPDTMDRVTSVAWANDNKTLFLTTEDAVTKRSNKLWRHVLGTSTFDPLYEEKDVLFDIDITKTRDRQYLLLEIGSADTTEFRYLRAARPQDGFAVMLPREKRHRYYVDHREGLFYLRTNKQAANFRVVTAPENDPGPGNWKTFVPHRDDVLVSRIDLFRDFAVAVEKEKALSRLRVYDFHSGQWNTIPFQEPVYAASPGSTPDYESKTYRYNYQSFLTPPSVFDYDTESAKSALLKQQEVLGGYDRTQYVSERQWVTVRDGVKVPLSIVYKRGFPRDGRGPLLLYGYGAYRIGMQATFSSMRFSLLDRGMAFVIAHIRGGDDLGEKWSQDGMLMKKKNSFYDFIDCAEYLLREKWTSKDRLIIEGGSAGGLLMGAVVNLRPDLFRAVHAAVPFLDVMNDMMDPSLPGTTTDYPEWGNPNEKAAYDYILSYSPYDNLRKGAYPAMLLTESLNDSQVAYWEAAKYVARLRTLQTDDRPLLLKMKMDPAGHGGASGRYDRLRDEAFEFAWMLSQVGITQ